MISLNTNSSLCERAIHEDALVMMMILGVSPLRGFPVERRGIGHLVPILCGRRLAGLVRLGGGVCPSAGCPVGTVVQLVGPAPTLHGSCDNIAN